LTFPAFFRQACQLDIGFFAIGIIGFGSDPFPVSAIRDPQSMPPIRNPKSPIRLLVQNDHKAKAAAGAFALFRGFVIVPGSSRPMRLRQDAIAERIGVIRGVVTQ
jgi:hypothetical protein